MVVPELVCAASWSLGREFDLDRFREDLILIGVGRLSRATACLVGIWSCPRNRGGGELLRRIPARVRAGGACVICARVGKSARGHGSACEYVM